MKKRDLICAGGVGVGGVCVCIESEQEREREKLRDEILYTLCCKNVQRK